MYKFIPLAFLCCPFVHLTKIFIWSYEGNLSDPMLTCWYYSFCLFIKIANTLHNCCHCVSFPKLIIVAFYKNIQTSFAILEYICNFSEPAERIMLTGRHWVRDVSCKRCNTKRSRIYEYTSLHICASDQNWSLIFWRTLSDPMLTC